MGTTQVDPSATTVDWNALARELNQPSGEEAAKRAFEIAQYVAKVEKNDDEKLMIKKGSKYFDLSLKK